MRRTWRRLATAVQDLASGAHYVAGSEPIDIRRLISPLRYDVLVRKGFFDLLESERRLYERDPDGFAGMAARSSYHAWFEKVYCARFDPALLRDERARRAAFRKRVGASASLYFSFEKSGFLPRHRIVLRTGCEILPSDSGKPVSASIFAGDGCHRLALLLKRGCTHLEPEQYVVKVAPRYAPLDNTALLLEALELSASEYAAFISASFSSGRHDRLEALLEEVAARNPRRLGELERVIAADRLFLHAH
jgi:hypothetical protein